MKSEKKKKTMKNSERIRKRKISEMMKNNSHDFEIEKRKEEIIANTNFESSHYAIP